MEATMSVRRFMHGLKSVYRPAAVFDWEGCGEVCAVALLIGLLLSAGAFGLAWLVQAIGR
jgi:hypothetical protein